MENLPTYEESVATGTMYPNLNPYYPYAMQYNPSFPFNPYGLQVPPNQVPFNIQQPQPQPQPHQQQSLLVSSNPPFASIPTSAFAPTAPPQATSPQATSPQATSPQATAPQTETSTENSSDNQKQEMLSSNQPATVPLNPMFMYNPGSFQNYS